MKSAPFRYTAPDTVEEVLQLLREYGDEAKLLAGGQSLAPMLNMRILSPAVMIDINRVMALAYRRETGASYEIGALTRESDLEDDRGFQERQPLAAAAIPLIAHRAIRNRGTIGGSLAHADPAAEWPAIALALDAEMVVARADEAPRVVKAEDFFRSYLDTALTAEDLLTAVRLPGWTAGSRFAFLELARRRGDFALAGAAVRLALDDRGHCSAARLVLFGVGATPLRALTAEAALVGEVPGPAAFKAAAEAAKASISPQSDIHASAEYRRYVAGVLVERALGHAAQMPKAA